MAETAEVVAVTSDGYPALTRKRGAYYLAGSPDMAFLKRLLARLVREAGIEVDDLPRGIRTRRRGGYRFVLNYGPDTVDVSSLLQGAPVIGSSVLEVGGLVVAPEAAARGI